jgi:hypothetical protein
VNFPFVWGNIVAVPAHGVYISVDIPELVFHIRISLIEA